jgi:hypothetical protein
MAVSPEVTEARSVELSAKSGQESIDIGWWRQVADKSGDLQMDSNGIYTLLGAKLSTIEDSPEPVHARCAEIQARQTRIDFTTLHEGSQLCAQSHGGGTPCSKFVPCHGHRAAMDGSSSTAKPGT